MTRELLDITEEEVQEIRERKAIGEYWSPLRTVRLDYAREIIDDLKEWWPLTLRQIHYRLYEKQVNWYLYPC